jgi:hypothetical protein
MPPLTHVLAGWCIGNLFPLTPRERLLAMAASELPDIDGLGLLVSADTYRHYHHLLAHNLTFAVVATIVLATVGRSSVRAALLYFALLHLHFLMDLFGSGPGWGIAYGWPWTPTRVFSSHAWSFGGWQNWTALALLTLWTLAIALIRHRTPCELAAPRLDRLSLHCLARIFRSMPISTANQTSRTSS